MNQPQEKLWADMTPEERKKLTAEMLAQFSTYDILPSPDICPRCGSQAHPGFELICCCKPQENVE